MIRYLIAASMILALSSGEALAKNKKHCPPGLAKKSPACVPPGLAKKGVTAHPGGGDGDDDHDDGYTDNRYDQDAYEVLQTGDWVTVNGEEYLVIRDGDRIVLRRYDDWYDLPGTRDDYVRIGDNLVRVDPETNAAIEIIRLADLILN